ncbi:MAG TPA: hypothetical protein VE549_09545, partial [Myxococcaceae bacterium]|nr:hypothetical protein [Myxococcaceae bacterium]
SWGFVKLGHTEPTRSNSGLQALVSMSLEFYAKRSLEIGDVLKPDYQQFIKEIENGVSQFETSTGTFMTDMIRFGPSKYDIAVVYESLAVSQLENAQGRWGNLKVFYPATTLWSDHPVALLQGDWVTEDQKKVARELVRHLRSRTDAGARPAVRFPPGGSRGAHQGPGRRSLYPGGAVWRSAGGASCREYAGRRGGAKSDDDVESRRPALTSGRQGLNSSPGCTRRSVSRDFVSNWC